MQSIPTPFGFPYEQKINILLNKFYVSKYVYLIWFKNFERLDAIKINIGVTHFVHSHKNGEIFL